MIESGLEIPPDHIVSQILSIFDFSSPVIICLSQGFWQPITSTPCSAQRYSTGRCIFNEYFEHYTHIHEERFAAKSGHLRPIVSKSVEEFLDCGLLHGGFARIRCPSCHQEHLLAFSCQTRNFCPSCQSKRGALLAEKLSHEVFYDVPHRHIVFTIPNPNNSRSRGRQGRHSARTLHQPTLTTTWS